MGHVGHPIRFTSGQFSGRTIRAELEEIQKADLGRKYAKVDRRPLDPPPVVTLRLFDVIEEGTDGRIEREIEDVDDIRTHGLLCTVDLFPVHGVDSPHTTAPFVPPGSSSQHTPRSSPTTPGHSQTHYNFSYPPPVSMATTASSTPNLNGGMYSTLQFAPARPLPPPNITSAGVGVGGVPSDIVHYVNGFPIAENSSVTTALVGSTYVMPTAIDHKGKKMLMFVFSDLAVKSEGFFILRYRMFDLFSRAWDKEDPVIQAECYGGMFRVYSTKEFPGLQASTELTKNLSRYGVRLNIRETERKRKKSEASPDHQHQHQHQRHHNTATAAATTTASEVTGSKRKHPGGSGDGFDEED
ncbi:hypothetical protein K435DRAFT_680440 [Dendrothele bispora CBS 962.96]|uniref:Velvet domain-containing protein n=1 Tax=Dendrothele bispora (strain CBS 962.96) TaxID=1314807 RepID=A0A4S8LGI3_DENBC|nr:hypothetical protein K435DRAFT_680440 [Dendrothele bispora CBS 962.96]